MNGPQHYAEAERLLDGPINVQPDEYDELRRDNLAAAQVHATLALVAATLDAAEVSHEKFSSGTRYEQPIEIRNWREVTA